MFGWIRTVYDDAAATARELGLDRTRQEKTPDRSQPEKTDRTEPVEPNRTEN